MLLNTYIKNSLIPKMYQEKITLVPDVKDIPAYDYLEKVEQNAKLFISKYHYSLLISSTSVGNGKTTWATRIAMAYLRDYAQYYAFENNTPVLFINVAAFINKKKNCIDNKSLLENISNIESKIYTAKLVIFDDIATKTLSEYDKDLLLCWIDYRTTHNLSCIYTTNIDINDLEDYLGARISSRIKEYSKKCLQLYTKDMRGVL